MAICAAAMVFTSCSDDDNNDMSGSGDNNTEIKGDYTATTNVKTVALKKSDYGVTIYEDFNYKYDLDLFKGDLSLVPYIRTNGEWTLNGYFNSSSYYYKNINMEDCGKMESISDVTEKIEIDNRYHYCPAAQPGHGYATCFKTEEETKYMRLYISSYKLDGEDSLESITVHYQLY